MEVSIATNSYQKITNQNIATEYNKSVVESKNQSLSQIKDTVDITLPKNLSDHSVKVLNCQNGSKALMSFSEKYKTISCYVQGVHGKITPVKPENLASTLKSIDTVEKLNGFLNNAYAKTSVLSNGDIKVDVSQQLKGGVMSYAQMQKKAGVQCQSPGREQFEILYRRKVGPESFTIKRGEALKHKFAHGIGAHSSIYVGRDQVIGVTNVHGVFLKDTLGKVEIHNIHTDHVSGKYNNNDVVYSLEQVALRAESKLGEECVYNLAKHNCHNFTNWCRTGVDQNSIAGKAENHGYKSWA